jgi:hypothetical protein
VLDEWKEPSEEQFFKDFKCNKQETDLPVGGEDKAQALG